MAFICGKILEIVAVEALIEEEGWLSEPEKEKYAFENMDNSAKLTPEMTAFWFRCGQNRDIGIPSILKNKPVTFKDILATDAELESESSTFDLKTMLKKLPKLISEIPETSQTKSYISELFKNEIEKSKNLSKIKEFYSLVLQIVNDSEELTNASDTSDEDSEEDDALL